MKQLSSPQFIRLILCFCCIVPSLSAIFIRQEIFPWSSFPMYSGVDRGDDLQLLSAFVVTSEGQETAIERTGILRPKYEYRWRLPVEKLENRELTVLEKETLQRFADIFKSDLALKKMDYAQVRFYIESWRSFSGPKRYHPDQRRLLFEQSLR